MLGFVVAIEVFKGWIIALVTPDGCFMDAIWTRPRYALFNVVLAQPWWW